MDNPDGDETSSAKSRELALLHKKQEVIIVTLEKKVAYLNEMIQAQEILLKDALVYTRELEEQRTA